MKMDHKTFVVIQWNVSLKSNPVLVFDLLKYTLQHNNGIVCLQEVREECYDYLINQNYFTDSAYSLNIRKPGKNEGINRKMGVTVLTKGSRIESSQTLERSLFPERTLYVNLRYAEEEINVVTFHSLTGIGYKKAKSANFAAIADFLEEHDEHIDFVCCDMNEPYKDSLEETKLEFFDNGDKGRNASLILGINKVHTKNDGYITYLKEKNIAVNKQPLAVSHIANGEKRRYDYILHSKKWKPVNLEYKYKEGIKHSSDHALVIGLFKKDH